MIVTIDTRSTLPPLSALFHGATEAMVRRLASLMASKGHQVNVVSNEPMERVADGAYWWPAHKFPSICDALIVVDHPDRLDDFSFQRSHVFCTAVDVRTNGTPQRVDTFVTLSRAHGDLLRKMSPGITERQVWPVPPGVGMREPVEKVPGRILYCNSPDRGLVHVARLWPHLLERVPNATIRVTYNAEDYLKRTTWQMDERGSQAMEIAAWIRENPETVFAGVSDDIAGEQARAELFAYPMDPLNAGVGVHCLAAAECAAAGCALLLSYHEGLPEVFGEAADYLALPVNPDDWLAQMADILTDGQRRRHMQDRALAWAMAHPWDVWGERWLNLVKEGM